MEREVVFNRKRHVAESVGLAERCCTSRGLSLAGGGVAYGGSIAYGLDTPESDVDLRGFALPSADDILGLHDFETVRMEDGVDIVLHSLSKMCSLLLACNPNAIEILGVRPEHVVVDSDAFRTLRANADWFVSRRCATTFGGYATQQLRRIQNAMNREDSSAIARNALRSVELALDAVPERYPSLAASSLCVSERNGRLAVSGMLRDASFAELKAFGDSCVEIEKNAANLAARNRKRGSDKLSKHASHLIRLLRMGSEMLETGAIATWRQDDRELLVEIKQGKWLVEELDGTRRFEEGFWDLLRAEEARFERAKAETCLPAKPDEESARDFVRSVHREVLRGLE